MARERERRSVDDVEVRAAPQLRRNGGENRSHGLCRAALFSDDLSDVLPCHAKLDDRVVVARELGHFDLIRMVHELGRNRVDQILERHVDAKLLLRFGLRRGALPFQKPIDRARRKSTLAAPVGETLGVDHEKPRIRRGVIRAEVLEEPTTARASLIGDDDAIERTLFGACAGKTNVNGHRWGKPRERERNTGLGSASRKLWATPRPVKALRLGPNEGTGL